MTSRRSDNQQRKQEVHSREYVVLDSEGEVELETGTEPFVEDPFGDFLDIDDSVADNAKHAGPPSNSSRADEANIREAPEPTFAESALHESVDRRVEPAEHSNLTSDFSLQQHIHVDSRSHQRNLHVSSRYQHSQATSASPSRRGATKSSMPLTPESPQINKERAHGDKGCPIELDSSDSDSDNDDSNPFPQREGSTNVRTASLNPTSSEGSGSANNMPSITQSSKATKISSVSDSRESSINARPVSVKNPTCETCRMTKRRTRCTHGTFNSEDSHKIQRPEIAQIDGQVSVVLAAIQQSTSEESTGDGDSHSQKVYTSTAQLVTRGSASDKQRSPSRANSHIETSIRPDSETVGVERFVDMEQQPKSPKEVGLPTHLPVTSANEVDDSEDSDPPMSFPLRRPLGRLKNANIANLAPIGVHKTQIQSSVDAMSDSSSSDEPLVPTWEKPGPIPSTGSVNSLVEGDVPRSSSQAQQEEDVRDSGMCSRTEQPLLDNTSSSSSSDSSQQRRTSNTSVPDEERPKLHARTPELGKHTTSSRSLRRVIRMPARYVDQSKEESVAQRLQCSKPSSLKRTRVQPTVASSSEATEPVKEPSLASDTEATEPEKQKPKFGLADIIPKEGPPKKASLTLRDIVPRKRSRKTRLPPQLQNFQDNVRTAFAPFLVGPEEILNAPPKKRKFTLADVIGMPQEPLFNIDEVIEQYLARQRGGEQRSEAQSEDELLDGPAYMTAVERIAANGGEDMSIGETRNDISEERQSRDLQDRENMLTHDSQDAAKSAADTATEQDLSEMLDDAEAFLAGEESTKSGNDVEGTPSARRSADPELPKPGHPPDTQSRDARAFASLSRYF